MPAALALRTAATDASAPALSSTIASTFLAIATSISWSCLFASSSWTLTTDLVAQFAGPRGRGVGLGLEERVVVRRRDDGDLLASGRARRGRRVPDGARGRQGRAAQHEQQRSGATRPRACAHHDDLLWNWSRTTARTMTRPLTTICQNSETPSSTRPSARTPMTNAPIERAGDRAAPAHERRAAEHDRRDRVQLERLARGGVRGAELGGDDHARRAPSRSPR